MIRLLLCFVPLLTFSAWAYNSPSLAEVYAHLGFNPSAENSGVIVQISDIHISEQADGGDPVLTNLDQRVVAMINGMKPRPKAIVVTGDIASNVGPRVPSVLPMWPQGSNELAMAKAELARLTNCDAMFVCPGNHDDVYGRYDGRPFQQLMGVSRYTNFSVANLPVVLLDSGNNGVIDAEQVNWLSTLNPDVTRPVLAFLHIPIHGGGIFGRQSTGELLRWLGRFQSAVWVGAGHDHQNYCVEFPYGSARVIEHVAPSTDALGHSMNGNPNASDTAGFLVWCITNGTVQTVFRAAITNGNFYTVGTNATWLTARQPFQNLTNVLFKAEEGTFDRARYSAECIGGDAGYWWIYATEYQAKLPTDIYTNATRALFEFNAETTNTVVAWLSSNGADWLPYPWEFYLDGVGSVVIPAAFRGSSVLFKATGFGQMFAGGFGLATTNTLTASSLSSMSFLSGFRNPSLNGATFNFEVPCTPGDTLRVEWSPNLLPGSWKTLTTTNIPGTRAKITDTRPPARILFYRVNKGS